MKLTSVVTITLAALAVSCGAPREDSTAPSTRSVVGDTTIVDNSGPGRWGASARFVEELRIGVLEGAPEYQFGMVTQIAVDETGGIYAFDQQVPALRYYDESGNYVRTLGREGQGPGEYMDASLGIAVRNSDRRVLMRDPRNGRLNLYSPDGTPSESWRVESGLFSSQAMVVDTADHMYLKILTGAPEREKPWPIALLHLDDRGEVVDTLVPPTLERDPQTAAAGFFEPATVWTWSPFGGFVVGVSDRYAVEHRRPDGTVLRFTRDIPPTSFVPEEREEHEAVADWRRRTQGQFMTAEIPPVPEIKPYFRTLHVGADGRFWVQRFGPAMKGDPVISSVPPGMEAPPPVSWVGTNIYDAFESDGAFLGSVTAPRGASLSVFKGDLAWGLRRGDLGETYVVRMRAVPGQ